MRHMRLLFLPLLGLIAALLVSGCSAQIDRNGDGSLQVETTMSEETIQRELATALSGKQVQDVTVDLREGWIQVSEVQVNGRAVPDERVDGWNQAISEKLTQSERSNENASLQSVTITSDAVSMQWRVTPALPGSRS